MTIYIARVYASLIVDKEKFIIQVPETIRPQVIEVLKEMGAPESTYWIP